MSDYSRIAERAKKAQASVARLELALQRDPSNVALQVNLAGMTRFANQTRRDMEEMARARFVEVCEYKIVPRFEDKYGLEFVSKSLLNYQALFSQIYDAMKNGIKQRAVLSKEASAQSALDFAFSYSGSLGIVLLAQNTRTLFSGDLDKPIEAIYQVLNIESADDVREIGHTLGRAVVKRVHDWSKANVEGGFSADVRWKRSDGKTLAQVIDYSQLERIVEHIEQAADEKTDTFFVKGMLVAGSLPARTFHISVPQGESFVGKISDAADLSEMTLGKMYEATILVTETQFYAQDKITKTNVLTKLVGPLTSLS